MNREDRYDSLIRYYAELNNLDWLLLKAQIKAESNFDPDARSKAGAVGLAQFMPLTWREWSDGTPGIQEDILMRSNLIDARDPEDCIKAQAAYMSWLFKYLKTSQAGPVLASYNWGIGKVVPLLKSGKGDFLTLLKEMPVETQTYISNIMRYYCEYKGV